MVELLIALTISATLLTAALVALDTMFKRYEVVSDQASTNVVSRTVMQRMITLIRQGREFGPYPTDPLNPAQNPLTTTRLEMLIEGDRIGAHTIAVIESRPTTTVTLNGEQVRHRGPNVLWLQITRRQAGTVISDETWPLLDGVANLNFTLEYEPGPRLVRATIDMTVQPTGNEYQRSVSGVQTTSLNDGATSAIATDANADTIRLIATTSPRGQVD
jgi:hypothetical protein